MGKDDVHSTLVRPCFTAMSRRCYRDLLFCLCDVNLYVLIMWYSVRGKACRVHECTKRGE